MWDIVLDGEPTLKDKVLAFFKLAPKKYSFAPEMDPAAKEWIREYKKIFDQLKDSSLPEGNSSTVLKSVADGGIIKENAKATNVDTQTKGSPDGRASRSPSLENKNNLKTNLSKGEFANEQEYKDSGILEGRVLSTVSKSENDQRQRSNDTKKAHRSVARDGSTSRYNTRSDSHRKNVSGYLARTDVVSPYHYKRYQESILRGLEGKLAERDSSGRILPQEIKERFKDTVLKNEDGELLSVFHWTSNTFDNFEYGDVGFHFGTYEAALDRRTGKSYEKGADRLKEVYLNIEKTVFLEDLGYWDCSTIALQLWEKGLISQADLTRLQRTKGYVDGEYNDEASKAMRKILSNLGYDGIIYQNATEGVGTLSVAALYPEQIYTVAEETVNGNNGKASREINTSDKISSKKVDSGGRKALADGKKETSSDVAKVKGAISESGIDPRGIMAVSDSYFDRYDGSLTRTGAIWEKIQKTGFISVDNHIHICYNGGEINL